MKKRTYNTALVLLILGLSLALNLVLGIFLYQSVSKTGVFFQTAEEASGANDFQYEAECNTVFGYRVCVSDFIGLSEADAIYKARTHGLSPTIGLKDGKGATVYVDYQLFRINLQIDDGIVTRAFFE